MDHKKPSHLERNFGIEKHLGLQKDKNENLPMDSTKPDSNANFAAAGRKTASDIRENNKYLGNNQSASAKINPKEARKTISSEVLLAMSKEAKQDRWIEFKREKEDLPSWLENNPPSKILRSSGVGWISVSVSTGAKDDSNSVIELEKAWETLASLKDEITITNVRELASQFSMTSGKWLIHVNSDEVDRIWGVVATALHSGQLGPNVYQAKVSPVADVDSVNNEHVICVYNKDFTDEEELMEVEASLRQAGLRCVLQYKPHIFSVLGIYRNNRWSLRPTIYQSQYEMNQQAPVIESILEKTWFWNNAEGFGNQEANGEEIRKLTQNIKSQVVEVKTAEYDKIIDRPCNYFNDVGDCKFKSGHLSKSGYTKRIHNCRHCFDINGVKQEHSELSCPVKFGGQQKTKKPLVDIKDFNNQVQISEGKEVKLVARPCDYFNDSGSCRFPSGHLSKSGFTKRVHICRLCFSHDGVEKTHPETQCDQMKDNTKSLLSIINSLNQLKMAESRGAADDSAKAKENLLGFGKNSHGECARRTKEENERKSSSPEDKGRRNDGVKNENKRNRASGVNGRRNKNRKESVPKGNSSENDKDLAIGGNNVDSRDQKRGGILVKGEEKNKKNTVKGEEKNKKNTGEPQGKSYKRNRKSKIDEHNSKKASKSSHIKDDSHDTRKEMDKDIGADVGLNTFKNEAVVLNENNQPLKASKKSCGPQKNEGSKKVTENIVKSDIKEKCFESAKAVKDSQKVGDSNDQHKMDKTGCGFVKDSEEPSMHNAINSLGNLFKSIQSSINVATEDKTAICKESPKVPEQSLNENKQKSKEEKHDGRNNHETKSKRVDKQNDKQNALESVPQANSQKQAKSSQIDHKPSTQEKLAQEKATHGKSRITAKSAVSRKPYQPDHSGQASTGKQQDNVRSTSSLKQKLQENHFEPPMNPLQPKMKHFQARQKAFHPKSEMKMFHTLPPPAPPQFIHNLPMSKGKELPFSEGKELPVSKDKEILHLPVGKGNVKRKPPHCPCPPYCPSCLDEMKNKKINV